ncbi:MAG: TrkA family potassium uptake protein, partial [Chloroflexi bacterium]|nr:TrkA family potassium uptake protein [Chloroflexota bacterium]
MFVLIAGGGRTGARLASFLINQNYKVRLIENRRALLAHLHQELPTEVVYEGNPIDPSALELAGLREANVVAAVTGDDSTNLSLCFIAKTIFDVPRTIARVNNPNNSWLFNEIFRVDVALNQADVLAHLIQEEMSLGDMMTLFKIRRGRYSVVEEKVPAGAKGIGV